MIAIFFMLSSLGFAKETKLKKELKEIENNINNAREIIRNYERRLDNWFDVDISARQFKVRKKLRELEIRRDNIKRQIKKNRDKK